MKKMAEIDTKIETPSQLKTMDEPENKKNEEDVKVETENDVKDDSDQDEKSPPNSPVKTKKESSDEKSKESPSKGSKKEKEKKEDDGDGDDDDDEDDDDDDDEEGEELPPGLLEQPLEVTGKREKKKVERLSATMVPTAGSEKKKVEIEEGSGEKLGDISYIEHQLNVTKAVDLKPLHRLLFARLGTLHELKRNIRQFCGFTHGKDSKEHEKKMTLLNKYFLSDLKSICLTLGVERGGAKKEIIERIMEFLMKPKDTGAQVKVKRRSKSAGPKPGKKRKRTSKKSDKSADKTSKKKKKKEKATKNDDVDDEDEQDDEESAKDDASDEEEEEEEEEENSDADGEEAGSESEDEEPKPKKAKTQPKQKAEKKKKKVTPKKVAKVNGKSEKAAKTEAKKATPKKKKAPVILDDDLSSEDSEDEPIAKMKKSPPSNDEIKDLVKKILEGADLETVTMKTVVKQVYAKYPSFDLSDRKDFIKGTVREVIS